MFVYPEIDPVAIEIGPLQVRWYGLTYLFGFITAWLLARYRASQPVSGWTPKQVDDFVTYGVLALILGARLGYVLFYGWDRLSQDPGFIYRIWEGGMSFHGGVLGILICAIIFARRQKRRLSEIGDFITPFAAPGLMFGRIGNFINAELWGRETTVPWAVVYPPELDPAGIARHPSQLYEAFLEGLVLFLILWFYSRKKRPAWAVTGVFLMGYGTFRFLVEFVREPDAHMGFIAFDWLTMGQLLSVPMVLFGAYLFFFGPGRSKDSLPA